MEEIFKFIWTTAHLIFFSVNSNAHESIDESTAPSYLACVPVYVEIDYSYLRKGEWVEDKKLTKVTGDQAINQVSLDVEVKSWGLVNCESRIW